MTAGKWDVVIGWKSTRSSRPHQDVCGCRPLSAPAEHPDLSVCQGMPAPAVVNRRAIEYGVRTALAFDCR